MERTACALACTSAASTALSMSRTVSRHLVVSERLASMGAALSRAHGVVCGVCVLLYDVRGVRRVECGVWCTWCVSCGVWCVVCVRFAASGTSACPTILVSETERSHPAACVPGDPRDGDGNPTSGCGTPCATAPSCRTGTTVDCDRRHERDRVGDACRSETATPRFRLLLRRFHRSPMKSIGKVPRSMSGVSRKRGGPYDSGACGSTIATAWRQGRIRPGRARSSRAVCTPKQVRYWAKGPAFCPSALSARSPPAHVARGALKRPMMAERGVGDPSIDEKSLATP